jgi:hypothetical protein
LGLQTHIDIARFRCRPSVDNAQRVLARPGRLSRAFAMALLGQMAKRSEPGLLFWPQALSEALERSEPAPALGPKASRLFFEWFEDVHSGHQIPLETVYYGDGAGNDEPLRVGGRRRLWILALSLSRQLARAGATLPVRKPNSFGAETCMVALEHELDPQALALSLQADWAAQAGRRWSMAISCLPWAWLADLMETLPKAPADLFTLDQRLDVTARVFAEGRIDEGAARILDHLQAPDDLMALRLSAPTSSTRLWESLDEPPALDQIAIDAGTLWGWPAAVSALKAPLLLSSLPTRPCLAFQINATRWDGAVGQLLDQLGPPSRADLEKLEGTAAGAFLQRALLNDALDSKGAPPRQPARL